MELPIPEKVQKIWDLWSLRGCIMLSLLLQIILVLFASSRQRCKNSLLLTLIWAAYLLADWVAAVSIGLITQEQTRTCGHKDGEFDHDIYAFWASFLLLHLGGPDTITSFALEDNEFWLRHLFGLVLQVMAAGYSFYLTLPNNKLWPPTLLVFFVGIIKYTERTRAFYLASLERFGRTALRKPEPGPDYEEVSTNYFSKLLQVPIQGESTENQISSGGVGSSSHDPYMELNRITLNASDELELLKAAHVLFERFKGLIVGFFLTSKDRKSCRDYFLKITDHQCAFRVVEYELSLLFQVLHTKVVVVRQTIGYILRFISLSSILGATIVFLLTEKNGFKSIEVILSYSLLIGAMVLDTISVIKLIFSDWILVVLKHSWRRYVPSFILKRERWSRLIFQYNMISYCLDERPAWFFDLSELFHLREVLDKLKIMMFSSSYKVTDDLQKFIFDNLKEKSNKASTLRESTEACIERGGLALSQSTGKDFASYIKLKWSISEFQYTESILLWHIATEICNEEGNSNSDRKEKRKSKILSEYMFYLLIEQNTIFSPVLGDWHLVFQDTCAEAKRFFRKYSVSNHSRAVEKMNSVRTKFRPAAVKGGRSKSVFFDACILAHQLQKLEDKRWDIMDQVWLELMSYAAINCRPIVHAQQPSWGGELITFTWLLLNHLGLGVQFSEQEERAGMKMVAVK
ncbi:uncharacterized protein LOC133830804 [Humulus lupulus]|uniref:uncharacterized protein LOC133830804 n=1 Tax=Humulus lupulus TaxID=3486 RepID=UPI002B4121A6|nr:uncharacterized protein LOC133830804 [Humulus lupulus]